MLEKIYVCNVQLVPFDDELRLMGPTFEMKVAYHGSDLTQEGLYNGVRREELCRGRELIPHHPQGETHFEVGMGTYGKDNAPTMFLARYSQLSDREIRDLLED